MEFTGRGFKFHTGQLCIATSKNLSVVNTIYMYTYIYIYIYIYTYIYIYIYIHIHTYILVKEKTYFDNILAIAFYIYKVCLLQLFKSVAETVKPQN